MASARTLLAAFLPLLAVLPCPAQQEPAATAAPRVPKPKPFEISHGNLFEAFRQMAAYRKLDLLIDPNVPNQQRLYAFKHTTWEKALESLLASHGLSAEIRDNILRVGLASRFPDGISPERFQAFRTISITYRSVAEGEAQLSLSVNAATKAEILDALAKVERLAKAKPDKGTFSANWTLIPSCNQ